MTGIGRRPLEPDLAPPHQLGPTAAQLEWCRSQIRAHCPASCDEISIERVPSRTAAVYRIEVDRSPSSTGFYLKCYAPTEPQRDLEERFGYLSLIDEGFRAAGSASPYRLVAHNAALRVLLTGEAPGQSLLSMHRRISRGLALGKADGTVGAWRGLGTWLETLHWRTIPPRRSTLRVQELADYTSERFARWAKEAPARARLAARALEAVEVISSHLSVSGVTITPCHGDVSAGNILLGAGVSLIDPDDLRPDLPGVDISQALMELREFTFVASVIPRPTLFRAGWTAFTTAYHHPLPEGAEFWLPHLRNLSVYVLTLATRCRGFSATRATEEFRYWRTIRELSRTVDRVVCADRPAGQRS